MAFEFKKFLTENKLTNQSKVKALFERDISDQYESISQEIEDEMDEMVEQGKITPEERSKAQTELESDDDYLSYGSPSKSIQLILNQIKKKESSKMSEAEEESDMDAGPSEKEISKGSTADLAKKQNQLAKLLKAKNDLVSKFKSNEININQYKQMIGNIPQHIKTLTADIEKLEGGELNEASYETLERIDGLVNRKDLELFKNALENITNELELEGFELPDVKAYIQRELDEILGTYK